MNDNTLKEVIAILKVARLDAMAKTMGITKEQRLALVQVVGLTNRIEELEAKLEG